MQGRPAHVVRCRCSTCSSLRARRRMSGGTNRIRTTITGCRGLERRAGTLFAPQ